MKNLLLLLLTVFCLGIFIPANSANLGKFNVLQMPDNNVLKTQQCYAFDNNKIFIIDSKNNKMVYSILDIDTQKYIAQGEIEGFSKGEVLVLKNGQIFIYGKPSYDAIESQSKAYVCIFNPKDNSYKKTVEIPYPSFSTSLLELQNGNILITGANYKHNKVLEYDIKQNTFIFHPDLKTNRFNHQSIEIEPNKVMLFGGEGKNIEIYDLNNNTSEIIDVDLRTVSWGNKTKLYSLGNNKYAFYTQRAFKDADKGVIETTQIIDPENPNSDYETFYHRDFIGILDLKNKSIEEILPDEKFKLSDYAIEFLPDNKILITGGSFGSLKNSICTLDIAKVYDLNSKKLIQISSKMHFSREGHKILKINPNKYLIYGGVSPTTLFPAPEIFIYNSNK